MTNKQKKITEALAKNKYVLLVILAGIVLLLLPLGGGNGGGAADTGTETRIEATEYSLTEQEERIAKALSQIDGAGSVSVVLTLKTTEEQVLAIDKRSSEKSGESYESSETTVVVTSGSQIQKPVPVKYIYPEYLGALIVAEGADTAAVRLELLNAVAGLTGLGADRITVTKMKKS